jgi:hypothetical protein
VAEKVETLRRGAPNRQLLKRRALKRPALREHETPKRATGLG